MADIPEQLRVVSERVAKGEIPTETVRTLLSWFGASRRGWRTVDKIRAALEAVGVTTLPDFAGEYNDAPLQFCSLVTKLPETVADAPTGVTSQIPGVTSGIGASTIAEASPPVRVTDPTHRIGRLVSANTKPISVQPDASVSEAVTLMLQSDFSQLPVMTNERTVKGLVSWKSIGSRIALKQLCETVRDCTDEHKEISSDRSIFEAIQIIVEHDCVLVRDSQNRITGIVTAADISTQYDQLAGPFLLLGEIENQIRMLLSAKLSRADFESAKDPADTTRKIEDATDLSFGEYVRLLSNPEVWSKMDWMIDRKAFTAKLDKVREIRNDVMHFDPDGIEPDETRELREFAQFLVRLRKLLNR